MRSEAGPDRLDRGARTFLARSGWLNLLISAVMASSLGYPREVLGTVESGFGVAAGGGPASGEESFKTDLFTGSATARIPLVLPPGTAGFQPQVTLSYNSRRGNGWVGRGWNLRFRSIRRMTKFGPPSFSDDPADPDSDIFALDDERLVRDRTGAFHTMRESFQLIEARRDPTTGDISYWVIHRPDGSTLWFGSNPDANSRIVDPVSSKTFSWLIDRAQDRNGNFIRYRYQTPAGSEAIPYPHEIAYSFRGDGGEAPGSGWPRSKTLRQVTFNLESRPDVTVSYHGGIRRVIAHRLSSIEIRLGSRTEVTTYDLVYLDETDRGAPGPHPNQASLLHQLVRVGADGGSELPADLHAYSGAVGPSWGAGENASLLETRLGELNGGGGFNLSTGNWKIVDVNGDAAPDIVFTGKSRAVEPGEVVRNGHVYINHKGVLEAPSGSLSVNPFFNDVPTTNTPIYHVPIVWDPDENPDSFELNGALHVGRPDARWIDYDGDGRLDLLWGFSDIAAGGNGWLVGEWRNTGLDWVLESSESEWHATFLRAPVVYASSCSPLDDPFRRWWGYSIFADLNGDGLPELLHSRIGESGTCSTPLVRASWDTHEVFLNRGPGTGWDTAVDPGWSVRRGRSARRSGPGQHRLRLDRRGRCGNVRTRRPSPVGSRRRWPRGSRGISAAVQQR
jgi:hypothetical protein